MHEGIAQYLGASVEGLVYSEAGETNIFLDRLPASPDRAVCVRTQSGMEADSKLPYDPVGFMIECRGESDGVWALATWRAIYSALQGLRNRLLPDGTYAVYVLASQASPFYAGDDDNGRPVYSNDWTGEILNPTQERPA